MIYVALSYFISVPYVLFLFLIPMSYIHCFSFHVIIISIFFFFPKMQILSGQ
jgi:hypothetical protein